MVKAKSIIQMHPREQLTYKARGAIFTYAIHRCKGHTLASILIRFTIEAERMPRERLYQWLQDHGYKWDTCGWNQEKNHGSK